MPASASALPSSTLSSITAAPFTLSATNAFVPDRLPPIVQPCMVKPSVLVTLTG